MDSGGYNSGYNNQQQQYNMQGNSSSMGGMGMQGGNNNMGNMGGQQMQQFYNQGTMNSQQQPQQRSGTSSVSGSSNTYQQQQPQQQMNQGMKPMNQGYQQQNQYMGGGGSFPQNNSPVGYGQQSTGNQYDPRSSNVSGNQFNATSLKSNQPVVGSVATIGNSNFGQSGSQPRMQTSPNQPQQMMSNLPIGTMGNMGNMQGVGMGNMQGVGQSNMGMPNNMGNMQNTMGMVMGMPNNMNTMGMNNMNTMGNMGNMNSMGMPNNMGNMQGGNMGNMQGGNMQGGNMNSNNSNNSGINNDYRSSSSGSGSGSSGSRYGGSSGSSGSNNDYRSSSSGGGSNSKYNNDSNNSGSSGWNNKSSSSSSSSSSSRSNNYNNNKYNNSSNKSYDNKKDYSNNNKYNNHKSSHSSSGGSSGGSSSSSSSYHSKKHYTPATGVDTSSSSDLRDKKYASHIPTHVYTQPEYDYLFLKKLFPKLYISPDFTRLSASWVELVNLQADSKESLVNFNQVTPFVIDSKEINQPKVRVEDTSVGSKEFHLHENVKYNAKVMLFQQSPASTESPQNITKRLKFLVAKEGKDISCIGGTWKPSVDGEDVNDPQTLINTAIRTTKEYSQFDLSKCSKWIKFMEVHYYRPPSDTDAQYQEVTVIFVPDLTELSPYEYDANKSAAAMPPPTTTTVAANDEGSEQDGTNAAADATTIKEGEDDPMALSGTTQDSEDERAKTAEQADSKQTSEQPRESSERTKTDSVNQNDLRSCFSITTPLSEIVKYRAMMLSLDGLLDYEESDKFEGTFEASLFGELFYLMMAREMGALVLQSLIDFRPMVQHDSSISSNAETDDQHKRKREDDATASNATTSAGEHQSPDSNDIKKLKQTNEDGSDSSKTVNPKPTDQDSPIKSAKVIDEGVTIVSTVIPTIASVRTERVAIPRYSEAFEFFDQNLVEYLKSDDVENIIHNLGLFFSRSYVQKIVAKVTTEYTSKQGRVYYDKVVFKTVPKSS